jgi:hypothetical protein
MFHFPRLACASGFLLLCALATTTAPVLADDEPEKLPDGVTKLTKEQLREKVPNFFCYDYPFQPLPGKRLWLRVDDKHFLERYPEGPDGFYEVIGHAKVRDRDGTIVLRVEGDPNAGPDPDVRKIQVFIPDKGNKEMAILFRRLDANQPVWRDMSWSLNKPTIIEKVE